MMNLHKQSGGIGKEMKIRGGINLSAK